MHHFYFQHHPICKHVNPWVVECLLLLLETWTLTFSLTNFKLAGRTYTLLILVMETHCSHLPLLCICGQYLSLQHYAPIFVTVSGGKTD